MAWQILQVKPSVASLSSSSRPAATGLAMSASGLVMIFVFIEGCGTGEEVTEPPGVGEVSAAFGAKLFWTEGLGTIILTTDGSAGVLLFGMDGATGDAAGVLGLGEGTVMQGGEEGRGVRVPSGTSSSSFSSDPFELEIS